MKPEVELSNVAAGTMDDSMDWTARVQLIQRIEQLTTVLPLDLRCIAFNNVWNSKTARQ